MKTTKLNFTNIEIKDETLLTEAKTFAAAINEVFTGGSDLTALTPQEKNQLNKATTDIGNTSLLTTNDKTSLVNSTNEINAKNIQESNGDLESNGAIITIEEQQILTNAVEETPSFLTHLVEYNDELHSFTIKKPGRFRLEFNGTVDNNGANRTLTINAYKTSTLLKDKTISIPSNQTQVSKKISVDIDDSHLFPFELTFQALSDAATIDFDNIEYSYTFTTKGQ